MLTLQTQGDAFIRAQPVQLLLARQHSHPGGRHCRFIYLPVASRLLPARQLPGSRALGCRRGKQRHVADLDLHTVLHLF